MADELASAVVERYAKLHARGELPVQPSKLAAIAKFAAIDELRKLERSAYQYAQGQRPALSLEAMGPAEGTSLEWRDEDAHDFPDRIADQLVAATRAGLIMGARLTPRERRVVRLLATGATQSQTARQMSTSESNISECVRNLVSRLERRTT